MTPEQAREIWWSESKPMNDDELRLALEAGETLGYLRREWDPIRGTFINSLTSLGVIAAEKMEREKRERRRQRRGFER